MTEINSNQLSKEIKGSSRAKKHNLNIDMTPMVDLGFLLITFFIFTTTIGQPSVMRLIIPNDEGEPTPIKESGSLTIMPHENGKLFYYEGILNPQNVRSTGMKEIRKVIVDKKRKTVEKDFYIVIKPTDKADYGAMVDILDEMLISDVQRYAIAAINKDEKALIK